MKKYIAVVAGLVLVGWGFYNYFPEFSPTNGSNATSSPLLPTFPVPSFQLPTLEHYSTKLAAWSVWEGYLSAAKAHDLPKLRTLSHQTSATCNNPAKEAECFGLMDSVYRFGQELSADEFNYIEADSRQIIMYTDGPERKILYFTQNPDGIKVLGLRFCSEDEENPELTCADLNVDTRDDDGDGWWNSTESLFYQ